MQTILQLAADLLAGFYSNILGKFKTARCRAKRHATRRWAYSARVPSATRLFILTQSYTKDTEFGG
jgi:hypothetical protein